MKKYFFLLVIVACNHAVFSQNKATITIDASKLESNVSPDLHGVFFEEISHGGEGGLYGELIQNRGFEESRLPLATTLADGFIVPKKSPHFMMPDNAASDWKMEWNLKSQWPAWSLQASGGSSMALALSRQNPLNNATPNSLQVTINQWDPTANNNVVNDGFWGINTVKGAVYNLSFYARTNKQYKGPITASLQSETGVILAAYTFAAVSGSSWKKYTCQLLAKQSNSKAKFVLTFGSTGVVWLDMVSLFPAKTFMNRPNGLRLDLAQYIADLKPAFVRWPGGCFVEGINTANTPNWKKSIGPVEKRPGTYSVWGYWSTDGFGYHEYLQFCEDIHAAALYVFNIGISCEFRSGSFVPDNKVDSIINDILDGIEYAVGPVTSKYGKLRAANGHPSPFPLKFIEVGNEQSGPRYAARYNRFYKAIKAKYPQIKIMASMGIGDVNKRTTDSMKGIDIVDEHAYKPAGWAMRNYNHFDKYKRGDWDMYVGEYATNSGVGAGNMNAALSDAVYIMSMEKNGDLVKMSSYAPLLVNVNDIDWPVNLINFDAAGSFARISYYAIKIFNENKPTQNINTQTLIPEQKTKTPLFTGSIGLATWDTQSDYKDIEVIQGGKVVYKSDFVNKPDEWKLVRGNWRIQDSALAQTVEGEQRLAWLKDKTFDTYTLKLKARKKSGYNAFIIPFAVKNDSTQLRAHIGSWLNSHAVFESVTNSFDVAAISESKRLDKPIESGRWYDVTIEVGMDKVDCYLDGELLMTYKEPQQFFSIAGKDSITGDIIIKAVNASANPYQTSISLTGVTALQSIGELISLRADSPEAENSFAEPTKYIPQTQTVGGITSFFEISFKPYSINVLRLHTK
ncbi:alpha-L-arabinofuranosidase C-terminal domain-containing protein [Ferruginibacter sp.]|uniref:alpha-L-arabinofuranosidase C-terminal domain-containing protein n=1 Tax=Ferruginibacter sp. TaxID=1940288 RepID=UPI0026598608|nr:alpha-L-arabinofuranosidase C-terminal domain-containing protein [Ferruginibacter sp.]